MTGSRVWLCVGPVACCFLDGGLTLAGQPPEYWAGRFDLALELNPLGRWPLQVHPLLFLAVLCTWALLFCAAILAWPTHLAYPAAYAVHVGHTTGAASWVYVAGGLAPCVLVLVASGLLLDWTWARARPRRP